jgi:N4-gp56 family major capsid protein
MLEWSVSSAGGTLTTPELSEAMRYKAQTKQRFRQLATPEEAFGLGRGDTLQYKKVGNADLGRVVGETELVPTSNLTFTSSSITAQEYTLGIDYTWRLDSLAKLDVYNIVVQSLINSMARTLDLAAGMAFIQGSSLVYTPTGSSINPTYTLGTAGQALAVATRPFAVYDHRNVMDLLNGTYNMPYYDDDGFISVMSTKFKRSVREDGQWERAVTPQNSGRIFRGELGELDGCRFIHETNVLNNAMGNNGVLGQAVYVAADAVMEIVVLPEEIQAKLGQDYGRDCGLRWVYYGAWAQTFNYAAELEARTLLVSSL